MHSVADFRSDTITRPSVKMKEAMFSAPLGDDGFHDDPSIMELEALACELTGKEAAVFTPSGTMANQIAIAVHTSPGDEILVEERGHIAWFEGGGAATNSLVQIRTYELENLTLSPRRAEKSLRLDIIDCPRMKLLCVENTLNFYGGALWDLDNLLELKDWAHSHTLAVHLDGARIFNASVASKKSVKEIATAADSLMFCLSKGLGAPVGSVLAGTKTFIDKARRVRKRLGGQMRQGGLLAAGGTWALKNNVARLSNDHELAKDIAQMVAQEVPALTLAQDRVDTNILFFSVPKGENANILAQKLEQDNVRVCPFSEGLFRVVTHLDVIPAHGRMLVDALKKRL